MPYTPTAYTQRAEIEAVWSPQFLVAALTDKGQIGETAGLFTQITLNSASDVDGCLSGQYTVPFTGNIPAAVIVASRAFVLWYIAERRSPGDDNPFKKERNDWLERLQAIGEGSKPLDLNHPRFVGMVRLPPRHVQPKHWLNIADWGDSTSFGNRADYTMINEDRWP